MNEKFVVLGKVLKTHGLKGEVRIFAYTDDHETFVHYPYFYISRKRYEVESYKFSGKYLIFKLAGVDSIEAASDLRGAFLEMERAELAHFHEGETGGGLGATRTAPLFISDLMGLHVWWHEGDTAVEVAVGEVLSYYEGGTDGLLEVRLDESLRARLGEEEKGREIFLMPCDPEYLGEIDLEHGKVWVKGLESLLALACL